MTLQEYIDRISDVSHEAGMEAMKHWDQLAKPLHGLGLLEDAIVKIAAVQGTKDVCLDKKVLVIFCADNGIVDEGVSQTGSDVTSVVTADITRGESCACIMAKRAGVDVIPVDIGVREVLKNTSDEYPLLDRKIAYGTKDFLKEPAMTHEETIRAIECGINIAEMLKDEGCSIIAAGEMGIGNTTTSGAVSSVLLGISPEKTCGRGAGLSDEGLQKKLNVIKEGISLRHPDPKDPIDVLSKVGGLDIAGLAGLCLGGALYHITVVLDGIITATAALTAVRLCDKVSEYLIASHISYEPAANAILKELGLKAIINGNMCLGEGTGAVALMPLLDMALDVYNDMVTFNDLHIEEYRHFT